MRKGEEEYEYYARVNGIEVWRSERACVHVACVCVREKETCRVSISREHWTNIDVSSLPFLSRDEKRVVLFIYQLLSSISEWKRGRARNCVNPCPFFSLPFPSPPPLPFLFSHRICSRCIRLLSELETSTSLFENKIPRIIGIRTVGIVLIGLNSKLMDNGNGWTCRYPRLLNSRITRVGRWTSRTLLPKGTKDEQRNTSP